jgi:hypothetical protein
MIEIATVYLILTFFGQNTVLALPMANMMVCESEKESIQAAYRTATTDRLLLFAHCVRSGLENSN